MGDDFANQSGRSDSFCGQREGWLLVSVLSPSWSTDLFPKTKSFLLIILRPSLLLWGAWKDLKGEMPLSPLQGGDGSRHTWKYLSLYRRY